MKLWKILAIVVTLTLIYAPLSFGAVSPEEAKKLGTTLTGLGAEMAGNKDGTIPAYTGGLTKAPANFKPGSGVRPDPFESEKPLFSINAQNIAQYADKLTDGTKALMKRFPSYRVDVYKTHRTVAFHDYIIKRTAENAVKAKTYNGGLSIKDFVYAGYPFPIPKDGYEAMWNHQLRYYGRSNEVKYTSWLMDANAKLLLLELCTLWEELPFYDEDPSRYDRNQSYQVRNVWLGPARKAGEAAYYTDPINIYEKPRVAYLYLPGQRRVKLAPEIGFDNPNGGTAGNNVYDEVWIFNGSLERYDWKLLGKKEVYVPYNCYRAVYGAKKEDVYAAKHLNPDAIRWELHRVWVIEATLKPGKRHIYAKRIMYLDEDSWAALAGENYDARGQLYPVNFVHQARVYDFGGTPSTHFTSTYNIPGGTYIGNVWLGEGGYSRQVKVAPERDWGPNAMIRLSIR
jgi:hypothetical protein